MVDIFSSIRVFFVMSRIFGTAPYRISGPINNRKLIFNKYDQILFILQCVFLGIVTSSSMKVYIKNYEIKTFDDLPGYFRITSFIVQLILNVSCGVIKRNAWLEIVTELETICHDFEMNLQIVYRSAYILFVFEAFTIVLMKAIHIFESSEQETEVLVFFLISLFIGLIDFIKIFTMLFVIREMFVTFNTIGSAPVYLLRKIFVDMLVVCKNLNKIMNFSIVLFYMGFESLAEFIYYSFFISFKRTEVVLTSFILWNSMNVMNVLIIIFGCCSIRDEMKKSADIRRKRFKQIAYSNNLFRFHTWEFNACNLFPINFSLLHNVSIVERSVTVNCYTILQMIGAAMMYLVILLQFHFQQ